MKKEILIFEDVAHPPSPFNHVVKAGNFLFITSQLSVDLKTNTILPGDIKFQTKNALNNLKFLLESSSSSLSNVVKVVVYLSDIKDFNGMNEIYKEFFETGKEPARVAVQARSPINDIIVEIEAIAIIEER